MNDFYTGHAAILPEGVRHLWAMAGPGRAGRGRKHEKAEKVEMLKDA